MPYKFINNYRDTKDNEGLWLKTFKISDKTYARSRAYTVWGGIEDRRIKLGSLNNFNGFQYFAEWCQTEYGYWLRNEDSGSYWCIDKDILSGSNKIYSEDTCLFVPSKINLLFKQANFLPDGSIQPRGINYCKDIGKYKVNISSGNKTKHIAVCSTYESGVAIAAKAWIDRLEYHMSDPIIAAHSKLMDNLNIQIKLMEDKYAS